MLNAEKKIVFGFLIITKFNQRTISENCHFNADFLLKNTQNLNII